MQHLHLRRIAFAILVLRLVPGVLGAQEMTLEAGSVDSAILAPCDMRHITQTCEYRHVDFVTTLSAGSLIGLDGRRYLIERTGPGYYLESGIVLEAVGDGLPGLAGQHWREIHPNADRIHISSAWRDLDGNAALSPFDTLELGSGRAVQVKDVRLLLWLKELPVEP